MVEQLHQHAAYLLSKRRRRELRGERSSVPSEVRSEAQHRANGSLAAAATGEESLAATMHANNEQPGGAGWLTRASNAAAERAEHAAERAAEVAFHMGRTNGHRPYREPGPNLGTVTVRHQNLDLGGLTLSPVIITTQSHSAASAAPVESPNLSPSPMVWSDVLPHHLRGVKVHSHTCLRTRANVEYSPR